MNMNTLLKRLRGLWFDRLPVGEFKGYFFLDWIGPGRTFRYIPYDQDPFRFIRANGEVVQPQDMITDAGSIPEIFHLVKDLDPWTYLPGFIIHDWEFSIGPDGDKSFKDVNRTLAEAIKTQMIDGYLETEIPEISPSNVNTIYSGVNSFIGKRIWESK